MSRNILPIPEFPGYFISNVGEVYSELKGNLKLLKLNLNKRHGRFQISIKNNSGVRKTIAVHILVAKVFLGKRPIGMQITHLDNNRLNNHVTNLKYCTPKENDSHKDIFGTRTNTKGQKNGSSKLTEDQVLKIRSDNRPSSLVAKEYGVGYNTIYNIKNNIKWSHIK